MFTIELTLKNAPSMLAIQQKEPETAAATYQRLVDLLRSGASEWVELSCDRTEKKVLFLSTEIAALQLTPKAGGSQGNARAGFISSTAN